MHVILHPSFAAWNYPPKSPISSVSLLSIMNERNGLIRHFFFIFYEPTHQSINRPASVDLNSPEPASSEAFYGPYPVNRVVAGLRGNMGLLLSTNASEAIRSGILLHTGEWANATDGAWDPSMVSSFVRSFVRSFLRSFLRSFVPSFLRSFVNYFEVVKNEF